MSLTAQAAIAIVGFFALAFGLAATLKTFGTAVFVLVVTALLTAALILQAVSDSHWRRMPRWPWGSWPSSRAPRSMRRR